MFIRPELGGKGTGCLFQFTYCVIVFCPFVFKTLSGNEILTSIDSYNTVTKVKSKPKIDLINVNAYANFAKIISSSSQDIEQIRIMTE